MDDTNFSPIKVSLKFWLEAYKPEDGDELLELWQHAFNYIHQFNQGSSSKVLHRRLTDFFMARETSLLSNAVETNFNEMVEVVSKRQQLIRGFLETAAECLAVSLTHSKGHEDQLREVMENIKRAKDIASLNDLREEMLKIGNDLMDGMAQYSEKMTVSMDEYRKNMDSLNRELDQLTQQAELDHLSGIFPRSLLKKDLTTHVAGARKRKTNLGLVVFWLQEMGKIEKDIGETSTGKVVEDFAKVLRESLRKSDTIYKYSKDQFVVILPRCSQITGKHLTKRIERFLFSHTYSFGEKSLRLNTRAAFNLLEKDESSDEFLSRTTFRE